MAWIWMGYVLVVLVVALVVGRHLGKFTDAYTEMTGMMAGMTMGMLNGFLIGFGAAAATTSMFWGNLFGILLGLLLGLYYGKPSGMMGIMDGGMGGVMGGSMGAMLAAMLLYPLWAMNITGVLLVPIYVAGMLGLVVLIEQSAPEHAAFHRLLPIFSRAVATEAAEVFERDAARTGRTAPAAQPLRITDYYALLGIDAAASEDAIADAYLQKLSVADEAAMLQLDQALATLTDPLRRERYDRKLEESRVALGALGADGRPACCPPKKKKAPAPEGTQATAASRPAPAPAPALAPVAASAPSAASARAVGAVAAQAGGSAVSVTAAVPKSAQATGRATVATAASAPAPAAASATHNSTGNVTAAPKAATAPRAAKAPTASVAIPPRRTRDAEPAVPTRKAGQAGGSTTAGKSAIQTQKQQASQNSGIGSRKHNGNGQQTAQAPRYNQNGRRQQGRVQQRQSPISWVGVAALVFILAIGVGWFMSSGALGASTASANSSSSGSGGYAYSGPSASQLEAQATVAQVGADGKQTLNLVVNGNSRSYSPSVIKVKKGVPVHVNLSVEGRDPGCGRFVGVQGLGVHGIAVPGQVAPMDFTPAQTGVFEINCSMHMMQSGYLIVTD